MKTLTPQQIEKYIARTLSTGSEPHIKGELEWLLSADSQEIQHVVTEVAK